MIARTQAQSFDRIAEEYDRLHELVGDHVGGWLPEVLPLSGRRALDLGCGAGRHTVILAERFAQVDTVSPRPANPRWWLYGGELRKLLRNSVRRGPAEAWEIYRLSTGAWLDHRVSDRYLSREQFERAYRQVFTTAGFGNVGRAHAMVWDAPDHPGGTGAQSRR